MNGSQATLKLAPARQVAAGTEQLLACLTELQTQLSALATLADDKLQAMRQADTAALNGCTRREAELLQAVYRAEQTRHATLAQLAQSLQCPELAQAGLSALAEVLPPPLAARVQAENAGLRQVALELERKNELATRVAQELQRHVRGVFAEIAKRGQETAVYGRAGRPARRQGARMLLDAMG